jgi:PAS domain S-box-containing protein
MKDVFKPTKEKPDLPEEMQAKWQRILDAFVEILEVRAAAIMKFDPPRLRVFLSSKTPENPFRMGDRWSLHERLYCLKVLQQKSRLLVPDALNDPEWEQNPAVSLGMTYYLGFPLIWPDETNFGTICFFDCRDNKKATQLESMIAELRELFEGDLQMITTTQKRENFLKELLRHRDFLRGMVAQQTAELKKNKEMLDERVWFDNMVSDVSAAFLNLPPEKLDEEIARALTKICRFYRVDHCGLFKVFKDHRQIHCINIDQQGTPQQDLINLSIAHPENPLTYSLRLVEGGEPFNFSAPEVFSPQPMVDGAAPEKATKTIHMIPLRIGGGQARHMIGLFYQGIINEWPVAHIRRLRILGEIFVEAILQSHAHERLVRSEKRLADAQRIAHLGSWEWDLTSGAFEWSDEVYRIFGLQRHEFNQTYEAALAYLPPDDRALVQEELNKLLASSNHEFALEHRLVRPDGGERVVYTRGEVILDANGKPLRIFGTIHDITKGKQAEKKLQQAFEEIKGLKEKMEAENIYLREEIQLKNNPPNHVGSSNAIKYVLYKIDQVAHTSTTVLLTGETGTGKNLFARYIHDKSDRRNKNFVNVNCAGLPPNLIESELFGREKGAFTGSTVRQIGRFELADQGTIFLDEIGELSLELQAKLLKVIETGEFERLGSPHAVHVDVRIIASSNRDLEAEVANNTFRKDLFYRLNIFPLTIPALRDRKEDIPLLVNFYTEKFNQTYHKNIKKIPVTILNALENYDWPGNVRELINVVERAVIVSDGPALQLAGQIIPLAVGPVQEKISIGAEPEGTKNLAEMERKHIIRALQETGWKIEGEKGAAQFLGINPSTMRARMRKLGIRRPEPL